MRRRPPWARELREARDARHAARLAHRMRSMQRHERRRWSGPHPVGIVVMMALVQVLGTRAAAYGSMGTEVLDRTGYLLLVAGPLALLVRERWPLVSLIGALVPTAAYFSLGYPDGPGFVAAIVAMFTALASGYRWLTWAAVAAAFTVFAVLVRGEESASRVVLIGVWCLVIAGFGEAARVRGMRYSQMARDWSAQQQVARAEEEKARVEQERRQASDERLLIARELHDVIGHHLSLINVQAGVGLHLMDEQPEQARVALTAIKHASAEALRETRSVLAGLNPGEAAPRTPTPGLRDLDRLVEEARAVGLPVTVDTAGTPAPLPPQVDRAAFRIVQEALTNVRRHAGPGAAATIVVGHAPGELTLLIADDGHGPTPAPGVDGGAATDLDDTRPLAPGPGISTEGPKAGTTATSGAPQTTATAPATGPGRDGGSAPMPGAMHAAGTAPMSGAGPGRKGGPAPMPGAVPKADPTSGAAPKADPTSGAAPTTGGSTIGSEQTADASTAAAAPKGGAAPTTSGGNAGGNGIAGMRHRAAAFGGVVEAGPRPGGGFEVRARIPVRQDGHDRPEPHGRPTPRDGRDRHPPGERRDRRLHRDRSEAEE
ncbi:histidine kinase [Dactylosporangium sp. NPDC005555]|uniref:histidine kinase n=1 Tax=Dactylosporangium sp. NPDC005555 TaxID=3154889 RepID=UPI0033BD06B7